MKCKLCEQQSIEEVIDFGRVALAGGFLKPEGFAHEQRYPLRVGFCTSCYSMQVIDTVEPETMFRDDYFYHASATRTMREHAASYANDLLLYHTKRILEIGCNDGVMLRELRKLAPEVIGVDPSGCARLLPGVVNEFFDEQLAGMLGKFDMIVANNVFAHMPDINAATRAVSKALSDDGIFVFENHYLGKLIEDTQYDVIYHEHVFYHSLLALDAHFKRHGMYVFDVKPLPTHAGSMRFYVCKQGFERQTSVDWWLAKERNEGLDQLATFKRFASRVYDHRREMSQLMSNLRSNKLSIAGYGASGRANTLIQWCGLDDLRYIVDDAPAKHGYFTPGSHLPIFSRQALERDPVDALLLFAWSYYAEVAPKCGDAMLVVPFPRVQQLTPASVA